MREGKGGVSAKKEVWELDKSMLLKLTKGQNEKKNKGIKKCEYKKHNVEGERKGRIKKIKGGGNWGRGGGQGMGKERENEGTLFSIKILVSSRCYEVV